jgi:hypothetical protein
MGHHSRDPNGSTEENEAMKLSVTGGVMSVEDGIKKNEEYAPPRKVRVELHFDVPEGEDADQHIGAVSALVSAHVVSLLGGAKEAKIAAALVADLKRTTTASTPEPGSKAALEAELVAKGASAADLGHAPQAAPAAAPGPKRTRKAADPSTPAAAPAPAPVAAAADPDELTGNEPAPAADDDLGDLTGEAKVEPISDLELNNAVAKRNAVIKSGVAIRKLVQTFNPDPGKLANIVLAQIPQERRADFLKKLEVMTAD